MNKIDNWSIHDPSWVSIDLNKFKTEKGHTVFSAMLNICLSEGGLEKDDMQMITIMTGIASSDYRIVLVRANALVDMIFGCPVMETVCLWNDGSVISEASMFECLNGIFDSEDD